MLTSVNTEWEHKLKAALLQSTEEAALRMKLEHEVSWAGSGMLAFMVVMAVMVVVLVFLGVVETGGCGGWRWWWHFLFLFLFVV